MSATAPRFDVTSLGESMLRLSVNDGQRLTEADRFEAHLGGAESNVCAALAALGRRTAWVGLLPDSPLGSWAMRRLRASGVDVGGVVRVPNSRLGAYFVELGSPPNPIDVTYDRAGSAAAGMRPDDIDWELLLDTRWLHLTGITPALGAGPAATVDEALGRAPTRGVKVSLDVNFRAKLWSAQSARAWLEPRLQHVDLLICGTQDAKDVFGLVDEPANVARALAERTRGGRAVVTIGGEGAVAHEAGTTDRAEGVAAKVVDRLGAGDAFAAGVLDGALDDDHSAGLRRGVVMGAAALGQRGDVLNLSRDQLERLLAGGAGRPLR